MIPRIHKRGQSFKGACQYILHDAQKDSSDRVLWTHTVNLGDIAPEDTWRAMHATWQDRTRLKREAGVDLRGRDNTNPVLHMTLAWAQDEKPNEEHMRATALSAMKALGLEEHQAQFAAHSDKEHIHVHLVINTVHPTTGRTAPLKYSKEAMSRWAEAYEREHGIKVEQRIKNNEERDRIREENKSRKRTKKPKKAKSRSKDQELQSPTDVPPKEPRQWVEKHRETVRPFAMQKKALVDRMRRLRTEIDHKHLVERDVTSSRQRAEREALYQNTRAAAQVTLDYVSSRFRGRWSDLFAEQRQERAHLSRIEGNIFERACYVFANSHRLGSHKPLTWRDKVKLIVSPRKLAEAVESLHKRERRLLSNVQKVETDARLEKLWAVHKQRHDALAGRHAAERVAEREQQKTLTQELPLYQMAKQQLNNERDGIEPIRHAAGAPAQETDEQYVERVRDDMDRYYERQYPARPDTRESVPSAVQHPSSPPSASMTAEFREAAVPSQAEAPSRAEQIRRDMEQWRVRNQGKDLGREI